MKLDARFLNGFLNIELSASPSVFVLWEFQMVSNQGLGASFFQTLFVASFNADFCKPISFRSLLLD